MRAGKKMTNSEQIARGSKGGTLGRVQGKPRWCRWSVWSQQEPGEAERKVQSTPALTPHGAAERNTPKVLFSLSLVPPYQAEKWQCLPCTSQLLGFSPFSIPIWELEIVPARWIRGAARTPRGWKEPRGLGARAWSCACQGLGLSRLSLVNPAQVSPVPTPAVG